MQKSNTKLQEGEFMEFHHVGIACSDIEQMKQYMNQLYDIIDISETIYDRQQEAELCMMTLRGGMQIELVSGKIVDKMVKKRQFLYHTCYRTKNVRKKVQEFEQLGAKLISKPKAAVLFGMKKVVFLMTKLGLVELLEDTESI